METLNNIYRRHIKGKFPDKGTIHSYIEVYEKIFEPYRHGSHTVLEIGILGGASLLMWEEYFASSKVYGVDHTDQPLGGQYDLRPLIAQGHNIIIMDATNPEQVQEQFENIKFDIIIDDASHQFDHQVITYNLLKRYLNPNGIYVIEDIQDIDKDRKAFESLGAEILDRRTLKRRYDDVMAIIR